MNRAIVLTFSCLALLGCGAASSARSGPASGPEASPAPEAPASAGDCPPGTRFDDCAHGSCPLCDDCVAACRPE